MYMYMLKLTIINNKKERTFAEVILTSRKNITIYRLDTNDKYAFIAYLCSVCDKQCFAHAQTVYCQPYQY